MIRKASWPVFLVLILQVSFGCMALGKINRNSMGTDSGQEWAVIQKSDDPSSLLGYFRYIHALNEPELQSEHERVQQAFSKDQRPIDRFRLALLLSLPQGPLRDYEGSLNLLADYVNDSDGQDPFLRDLAFLLSSMLNRLKDQQERHQKLDQKLKEEQKLNETLQKKLEELKTIEKSLMERDKNQGP